MKKRGFFALMLMGFTSLVVQALFIREFLVSFYGNEFTIGIILACWIVSEAIGSRAAGKFVDKVKIPFLTYAFLQSMIAICLPISIFLIRNSKNLLTATPGEAVGIIPIIAVCIFTIGPISIIDGLQFPLGCKIHSLYSKNKEKSVGKTYIMEAVGFILAGPIFTYILLGTLNSFQIAFLIGLINLLSALSLREGAEGTDEAIPKKRLLRFVPFGDFARNDKSNYLRPIIFILLLLNLYALLSDIPIKFHDFSISKQWKNQNLLAYENSMYGNLAVSKKEEQYTFYSNGISIINIPTPDITRTEEFIHFGLLSHADPKMVLMLSGGAGGPITEALKHPLDRIDYAELNPALIDLLKKFPKEITKRELSSPRVNLIINDGVKFVKRTKNKYDVVFINLPSPSTLQLNRYYTKEFFTQIRDMLAKNGHLVLSLPGSLSYLNDELRELNLCILDTLKDSFQYVAAIPGYNNIYISSSAPLEISPEIFMQRISQRNIHTASLDRFHIEDRLKQYWQDWFYETIKKSEVKKNLNLTPAGTFYAISYWNSLFNPLLKKFFSGLNNLTFAYLLFLIIIFQLSLLFIKWAFKFKKIGIAASIATTGFAGMSLNLIFILSYQIFFGYMFHHIALLVTSFMLGLTIGGYFMTKNLERIKRGLRLFITLEISILSFSLAAGLFLLYLNRITVFSFYPIFYILSVIIGFLVGSEFPLANRLYRSDNLMGKTAGTLYALDLFGAFFSALLVSIIFIPIFGVFKTCLFLAILKMLGLTLLPDSAPEASI